VPSSQWTEWPTREALSRVGVPRVRIALDIAVLASMAAWVISSAYASGAFHGWRAVLPALGLLCCTAAVLGYHQTTLANRLLPSLGLLAAVAAVGAGAYAAGATFPRRCCGSRPLSWRWSACRWPPVWSPAW
jgi:hypothetical protein